MIIRAQNNYRQSILLINNKFYNIFIEKFEEKNDFVDLMRKQSKEIDEALQNSNNQNVVTEH